MGEFLVWLMVAIHIGVVVIIPLGMILTVTNKINNHKILAFLYYLILAGTIVSFLWVGGCILTTWENDLRKIYLPGTEYDSGFISHYLGELGIEVTDGNVFRFLITVISIGVLVTIARLIITKVIKKRQSS